MDQGIGQFIPLILIFVIFYFFLIRPQQKKVKEHKAMVENLKRGDKVVTTAGIIGTIERVVDNERVEVLISENVKVEIIKSTGIQGLLNTAEVKK
ncbi:MAG: preprotein translocase subunit YajC [Pelagibacteraceae bacterium BACL20 MAG-120920-bin64]|jgi:preprotein translocase subunit YajC|nr:MAG: preprotein translocase subunit YajC [Pelagibacteraceae bacterium BACL20 MAG-120920-bin64]NQW07698.1 preprotein translocase subunit YajC [Candidatus Pelagibacter sp.]|tara:strand:- start:438 stop:722 length:285 start_codon:yes stop_codon:yes gene_type:complete